MATNTEVLFYEGVKTPRYNRRTKGYDMKPMKTRRVVKDKFWIEKFMGAEDTEFGYAKLNGKTAMVRRISCGWIDMHPLTVERAEADRVK